MSTTILSFALALVLAAPARSEDPKPEDLVRKALQATGFDAPDEALALRYRYGLSLGQPEVLREKMVLEAYGHSSGGPSRMTIARKERLDRPMAVLVSGEKKAWMARGEGEVTELPLDGEEGILWREMQHSERVTWLAGLLYDRKFTLTYAGEERHDGRAVLGVKVEYPERNPVFLWFDKKEHLLRKAEFYWLIVGEEKVKVVEEFQDYKEWDWSAADEKVLRGAGIAADGPGLLDYLKDRVKTAPRADEIDGLIRQLGDRSFSVRERAMTKLREIGKAVLPALRRAAAASDAEVARRSRELAALFESDPTAAVARAAVRLVGYRKPEGATEALLAYLKGSLDDEERHEVLGALMAVAVRDGKPEPTLLEALKGPEPARGFAAAALGRDDGAFARQPGRRLYPANMKIAHRLVIKPMKRDLDQLSITMEVQDLQLFNRHDPKLFERPLPLPPEVDVP